MSPEQTPVLPDLSGLLVPEARAFVVLHKDPLRERIDVRVSKVLGLEDDVLFLAQTEPPVERSQAGADVEVVFLAPDAAGTLRSYGCSVRLLDVREDYPLRDTWVTSLALTAPRLPEFFETSLRMHYRVPVDEGMGVVIRLPGYEDVQLLDFSAGGARVRLRGDVDLRVGEVLPFKLLFLGSGYADGDGVVRSVARGPDGSSVDIGIFFTNMEIRDVRYLERMVARTVSVCRQREQDADYHPPVPGE